MIFTEPFIQSMFNLINIYEKVLFLLVEILYVDVNKIVIWLTTMLTQGKKCVCQLSTQHFSILSLVIQLQALQEVFIATNFLLFLNLAKNGEELFYFQPLLIWRNLLYFIKIQLFWWNKTNIIKSINTNNVYNFTAVPNLYLEVAHKYDYLSYCFKTAIVGRSGIIQCVSSNISYQHHVKLSYITKQH